MVDNDLVFPIPMLQTRFSSGTMFGNLITAISVACPTIKHLSIRVNMAYERTSDWTSFAIPLMDDSSFGQKVLFPHLESLRLNNVGVRLLTTSSDPDRSLSEPALEKRWFDGLLSAAAALKWSCVLLADRGCLVSSEHCGTEAMRFGDIAIAPVLQHQQELHQRSAQFLTWPFFSSAVVAADCEIISRASR